MTTPGQDDLTSFRPLQFSLRWLLIAVTGLAVLFGILGPWLRNANREAVVVLAGLAVVTIVVFSATLALISWRFNRRCRKAGPVLWALPRYRKRLWRNVSVVVLGIYALMLLAMIGLYSSAPWMGPAGPRGFWDPILNSGFGFFAFMVATLVFSQSNTGLMSLFSRRTLACEQGLIDQLGFIPWKEVKDDEWQADGTLWIRYRFDVTNPIKLKVAEKHRDTVEAVLEQVRGEYFGAGEGGAASPSAR